jgi:hypothetical protein
MRTGMSFGFSGIGAPRRLPRRRRPPQPQHGPLRPHADLLWRRHAHWLRNARHSTHSKVRRRHYGEDLRVCRAIEALVSKRIYLIYL